MSHTGALIVSCCSAAAECEHYCLAVRRRGGHCCGGDDGHDAAAGPEGYPDAVHSPWGRAMTTTQQVTIRTQESDEVPGRSVRTHGALSLHRL